MVERKKMIHHHYSDEHDENVLGDTIIIILSLTYLVEANQRGTQRLSKET